MPERDPRDIVRLITAPNPAQAHIWAQALENEGIEAKVVGDYLNASLGNIPGTQAEVWVHREDVTRAEAVLEQPRQATGGEAEEMET